MFSHAALFLLSVLGPCAVAGAQLEASKPATPSTGQRLGSYSHMPVRLVKRADRTDGPSDPDRYGRSLKIPAPTRAQSEDEDQSLPRRSDAGGSVTFAVLSSLAIVLGVFFLVVWLARRALPKSAAALPKDVLEVLGRSPLAARHNLQLIRLGRRLLLVSVTPETAETLAEITDLDEVNHLSGLCRQSQAGSVTSSFREALHQMGTPKHSHTRRSRGAAERLDFEAGPPTASQSRSRHQRETL